MVDSILSAKIFDTLMKFNEIVDSANIMDTFPDIGNYAENLEKTDCT